LCGDLGSRNKIDQAQNGTKLCNFECAAAIRCNAVELKSTGVFAGYSQEMDLILSSLLELDLYTLSSSRSPSKQCINLIISRPRVRVLDSFFLYFFLSLDFFFFECSLQSEELFRKLRLSSSIAVALQASQTAIIFYQFSYLIVCCISALIRLQFSSTIVQDQLLTVLLDYYLYLSDFSDFIGKLN
jgi:hypothetical protein